MRFLRTPRDTRNTFSLTLNGNIFLFTYYVSVKTTWTLRVLYLVRRLSMLSQGLSLKLYSVLPCIYWLISVNDWFYTPDTLRLLLTKVRRFFLITGFYDWILVQAILFVLVRSISWRSLSFGRIGSWVGTHVGVPTYTLHSAKTLRNLELIKTVI